MRNARGSAKIKYICEQEHKQHFFFVSTHDILTRKFHFVVVQNNGKELNKKVRCSCKVVFCFLDLLILFFTLIVAVAVNDFLFCLSKL